MDFDPLDLREPLDTEDDDDAARDDEGLLGAPAFDAVVRSPSGRAAFMLTLSIVEQDDDVQVDDPQPVLNDLGEALEGALSALLRDRAL